MTPRPFVLACLLAFAASRIVASDVAFKVTDAAGQPVADAVIALYPLDAPMPPPAPASTSEIEQSNLEFHPFVTALRVGSAAVLPNREKKIEHHVYSSSPAKPFEFPLYKPGKAETVVFDKPGLVVLGCNIHDAMLAYVVVLDTAWFAKTPADGTTTFTELPTGRWRAEIWHPRLKDAANLELAVAVKRELTLPARGAAPAQTVALPLEPDRRSKLGRIGGGGYK